MTGNYTDNANIFKALGDENRLKILELLLESEKCGSELLEKIELGQSTLSHHLKLMCVSGIIKSSKKGTATYYSVNPDGAKAAVKLLCELTGVEKTESTIEKFTSETAEAESPVQENDAEEKNTVRQTGSRPNGWLL